MHYKRWYKHGNPNTVVPGNRFSQMDWKERFQSKVEKLGPNDCWEYTSGKFDNGYGQFWMSGRNWKAHRISWMLENGEIPGGILVCHTCDNPPCCNPNHLFLGTNSDNILDAVQKGRASMGEYMHLAKLIDELVLEIRSRYALGETQTALAREYLVSQPNVGCIVRGDTWKHLPVMAGA